MMCGGHVFPFAIYNDKRLVGFIQIGYGENADQDGVSVEKDNYEIWRFMIDKRYQGRGYGREAVKLALDFIRTMALRQGGVLLDLLRARKRDSKKFVRLPRF